MSVMPGMDDETHAILDRRARAHEEAWRATHPTPEGDPVAARHAAWEADPVARLLDDEPPSSTPGADPRFAHLRRPVILQSPSILLGPRLRCCPLWRWTPNRRQPTQQRPTQQRPTQQRPSKYAVAVYGEVAPKPPTVTEQALRYGRQATCPKYAQPRVGPCWACGR